MEKSEHTSNKSIILTSGIMVALYVTIQFSIYLYNPNPLLSSKVDTPLIELPKEATILNVALTYMVSIVGIAKN
jgi:hypothetical protein